MSEKQNVTLSLPKNLVRKAKIVAIDHNTSLSRLMAELLTDLVDQEEQYAIARQKHLAILEKGFDLGSNGNIMWTRESLHDR